MKKNRFLLLILALVAFGPTAWAQDLIINSASDWDAFAANVNNGTTYNGKTVKLNADISVSTMVGSDWTTHSFQGTFNGGGHTIEFNKGTAEEPFTEDYCAPFRYIRSATIKNLHTTGTIYTSGMRAGGIVATARFPLSCSLSSCRSSMTIHCKNNTDCGGLVAHVDFDNDESWRNFNIDNCLFDGTMVDDGGSRNWGGFIGWVTCSYYTDARLKITNCLFNPVAVPLVNDCKTFVRFNSNYDYIVVISNCYYKKALGGTQGNVASDNNATLLSNLGSGWEIVTENNVEKVVPIMPFPIMPSLRPFTGGAGTEESPYQIANATDWDNLAYNVNTCEENYSGKYFKLTNSDLTVTTMVGTSGASFCGTFDGDGDTLTINLTATDNYCAPFRYINGATIKHLHVEGTINGSNKKQLAGLVGNGNTTGTNTISNCSVNVSMTTTFSGDASIGGLIANISTGTTNVEGCAFTGSFNCPNANNVGGLVGWRDWKAGAYATLSLTNCLFMPTSVTFADNANNQPLVRSRSNSTDGLTITNCYITNTIHDGNLQGKQARTITGSNVTVENAGTPSSSTTIGVIGYGTGIKYNNTLYAGNDDNVSLNLTVPMGMVINSANYTQEGSSEPTTMTYQTGNVYSFTMPNADVTINAEIGYWVEGSGTAADPFKIFTTDDFDMLSTLVREVPSGHPFYQYGPDQIFYGYYFKLMNDLVYTDKTFTPVGYYNSADTYRGFGGTFDGQGHVIMGINYVTDECAGIFGFASGDISNLALVSSNLTGGHRTGGIVGHYYGGTLSNCHVASDVNIHRSSANVQWHGGIVGRKAAGTISYCTSAAIIEGLCSTGGDYYGGIAGSNFSGSITNCLFTDDCDSFAPTNNKGPIAGSNNGITYCYWTNSSFGTGSGDVAFAPSANNDNSGFINTINALQSRMTVESYSPAFKALAPNGYTLQKTISAWSENPAGGWYLIASPVEGNIAPEAVMNLLGTQIQDDPVLYNYDLYRFNQSPEVSSDGKYKEWENYHQHNTQQNLFRLVNGKGYLYARSEAVTLTFTGTFNTNNEQNVSLIYDQYSPHSDTRGWNLVGNPFGTAATVDKSYYRMNDDRTEIVAGSGTIAPMEGIFVQAKRVNGEETIIDETVTFTPATQNANSNNDALVVMNLTQNRGSVIDRAIVRFGNDNQLPKFQLFDNSTKLAIAQEGKEYAIVSAQSQGEMPLNLKAKENGEYTISVNPENVEMNYLHLIDNMTGADIDLLATPSYTFNAKTTDYESRFRLVFSAIGDENGGNENAPFAFVSNGQIIITGIDGDACNASLQMVDVMGRVLACRDAMVASPISTTGMASGVYVLRLVCGDNVRTQKMVIQ